MKVFIIASLTADGFLARHPTDFAMDWTSPEDTKSFVELTKQAGVVVMGARTFGTLVTAGRKMPGRKMIIYSFDKNAFNDYDRGNDVTEITQDPPAKLVKRVADEGYKQLAICGGSSIYNLFMESGVVDELYITIEPKIFGSGLSLFGESQEHNLRLLSCKNLSPNTLQLHYKVIK